MTSCRGDAERIASAELDQPCPDANERLCLVPCSGDGTVQEVVNALVSRPTANGLLGLAPGGRCNDFATTFGISRHPQRIAATLLAGCPRRIDLGRINGRCFCTVAALGFDAAVSRYVNDTRLPFSGTPAYTFATLRLLFDFRPFKARLTFDEGHIEDDIFLCASANTPTYGVGMRIAPDADPADGLLDVCVVSRMSRLKGLNLLRSVLRGRHTRLPGVRMLRTSQLKIETAVPHEAWADGEHVADTPLTIAVAPRAVELLAPAPDQLAPPCT